MGQDLIFYNKKLKSLALVVRSIKAKHCGEQLFFYGGLVFITYYFSYKYFYTILISTDLLELKPSPNVRLNLLLFPLPTTHNCQGSLLVAGISLFAKFFEATYYAPPS